VRAANAEEVAAREEIEAIIRTRTRDEWYDFLVKADVCVGKVYEPEEVVADPQVQARDMIVEMRHPVHGTVKQFGQPIKLSATPGTIRSAAPHSGEHTDQVLGELGIPAGDIKTLRDKKIVA
jgi:formyl-CoA transferase